LTASLAGQREMMQTLALDRGPAPKKLHFDLTMPRRKTLPHTGIVTVWVPPGEFVMGARGSFERVEPVALPPKPRLDPAPIHALKAEDPGAAFAGLIELAPQSLLLPKPVARPRPPERIANPDERPAHRVVISKGMYVGITEVTQAQYEKVMKYNPSHFRRGNVLGLGDTGDHPVERVSYHDALEFCRQATLLEALPTGSIRLLTEAEWEYVARGGEADRNDPFDEGLLADNSGGKTRPVGHRRPNGFGVHDMLGNVREWTDDWYGRDYYAESPLCDPKGPAMAVTQKLKVIRGGSFADPRETFRMTERRPFCPTATDQKAVGFRVVVVVP
jgi:formylglycine-generating enzyme required for sulfatase activity